MSWSLCHCGGGVVRYYTQGSTNDGAHTCTAEMCGSDQRVLAHACTACEEGFMNDVLHHVAVADTACEAEETTCQPGRWQDQSSVPTRCTPCDTPGGGAPRILVLGCV